MAVDSLDDAPTGLADHYKPGEDGKFYLDVDTPVDKLKKALGAARGDADQNAKLAKEREATATALQAERDAERRAAAALRAKMLDQAVTHAAQAAGLIPSAVADAVRAAREAFVVNGEGAIVGRDPQGKFADLAGWLAASRETSPHWHPATASGMGSPTNRTRSSGADGNSVSRSQFDAASPAQRAALVARGVTVTD